MKNSLAILKKLTPARIALGRAGNGLPTKELLGFGLAHARARDAVHAALDADAIVLSLKEMKIRSVIVRSQAANREAYLRRPDLGRRLDQKTSIAKGNATVAFVIADGLSALAVERHAVPLIRALVALAPQRWADATAVVALQARVALGDEVGERLGAQLVAVLIGERPGLSSPDSLGVYLTYQPRVGRTDAERNCISNIRPEGLTYEAAARRLDWLAAAALARGMTGVGLKDESASLERLAP